MNLWVRATLLLIACTVNQGAWSQNVQGATRPSHLVTQAEKLEIIRAVKEQLRDPESARFKWSKSVVNESLYCGWVNSKNGYGGYSGFTPFYLNIRHYPLSKQHKYSAFNVQFTEGENYTADELLDLCHHFGSDIAGSPDLQ